MNTSPRFADPGVELGDFATYFVVHCPKCAGKAHINPAGNTFPKYGNIHGVEWRLTCTACFHVEKPGHWHGAATAFVSVKCRECHAALQRSAPWDGPWKKLAMHCDACGDDCEYAAQISRRPYHEGRKTDPVFGLPLWLQKTFREEHLGVLQQYIGTKLRERGIDPRNTIQKNSAMLSRLPEFMKKSRQPKGAFEVGRAAGTFVRDTLLLLHTELLGIQTYGAVGGYGKLVPKPGLQNTRLEHPALHLQRVHHLLCRLRGKTVYLKHYFASPLRNCLGATPFFFKNTRLK
jgi:hypothetical protein